MAWPSDKLKVHFIDCQLLIQTIVGLINNNGVIKFYVKLTKRCCHICINFEINKKKSVIVFCILEAHSNIFLIL